LPGFVAHDSHGFRVLPMRPQKMFWCFDMTYVRC